MAPSATPAGSTGTLTATANQSTLKNDLSWTFGNGTPASLTIQRRVAGTTAFVDGPVRSGSGLASQTYTDGGADFSNSFVGGTVYEYRLKLTNP
jgi:hypothetical protein